MSDLPGDWLAQQARLRPRAAALGGDGVDLDYARLADRVDRAAGFLVRVLGLPQGARVAWLGHNRPDVLVAFFACARAGLVYLPLNWRLAGPELEAIAADAEPAALIVDEPCAPLVSAALAARCGNRVLVLDGGADLGPSWPAAIDAAPPLGATRAAPDDPLLLVYTSGTTGKAKGALLTNAAISANAVNAIDMHGLGPADHVLTVLPLFHVGGLNIQTTPALRVGARVSLLPRFEPEATLEAIATLRPSLTVQVPATLQALLRSPALARTDLSALRAIATGSTDVPTDLIEAFHARGVPVIQVYGATETAPVAIYQRPAEAMREVGTLGRCGVCTAIRLVDGEGRAVADGEPGEILVRGPHVAREYWRDPASTRAAFRDGWFHSGDVASRDEHGRYWFRDRIKNVIIAGGENVYPAEIERVAREHPGLAEVAVIGRPDPRWGAVPVLVAVPEAGGFDLAALRARFDAALARYKHPREIIEVDALPRTALGKVDLVALRARVAERLSR